MGDRKGISSDPIPTLARLRLIPHQSSVHKVKRNLPKQPLTHFANYKWERGTTPESGNEIKAHS